MHRVRSLLSHRETSLTPRCRWRFSVVEMQAMIFTLIENFAFDPAPNVEIGKCFNFFVVCYIKGEEHKGPQTPVIVRTL